MVQAMAAHNTGGVVIVQVERVVASGSLPARLVHIPGAIVDKVSLHLMPAECWVGLMQLSRTWTTAVGSSWDVDPYACAHGRHSQSQVISQSVAQGVLVGVRAASGSL